MAIILTNREKQVLELLVKGYSNQKIADYLNAKNIPITARTVSFHLSNIYKKLNIKSRYQTLAMPFEVLTSSSTMTDRDSD
jgi:DNA-binding NarL/FixJ family response regulator